jgi:hypothetical protein
LKKKEEEMYIEECEKLNRSRIDTINKSISKVDKLKLLREYYTIAIKGQNIEID